jgi:hypothetical protein
VKTLKLTTTDPGFMGMTNMETIKYKPGKDVEVNHEDSVKLKGDSAYIHGDAEAVAGYDIPIFFDGDILQLDKPEDEQDIIMYINDKEFKIKAKLTDSNQYYLTLKEPLDEELDPRPIWTTFWDMHSGGGQKLDWGKIYIEASEHEAVNIFQKRFDRSPYNVTCDCCGPDYSVSTSRNNLDQITGYHRGCRYDDDKKMFVEYPDEYHDEVVKLEDYIKTVLIIRKEDIIQDPQDDPSLEENLEQS